VSTKIWEDTVDARMKELRETLSQRATAERLSEEFGYTYTRSSVKNREGRLTEKKPDELPNYKSTVEICKDGSQISDTLIRMSVKDSKTPSYLLKEHGYDESWEIINAKSSIWNQNSKERGMIELFASKITVKPKQNDLNIDDIKEFFANLSKNNKRPVRTQINYNKTGKLLELNIADLHLNKLCWTGDSGDHYDEKVAEERFFYIINDVLTRTSDYKLSKILFIWSHDFFHVDNMVGTTTGGTPQDTVMRAQRMFKLGTRMLVQAIDLLSQYAPIESVYVGANHDKVFSYMASEYLSAWYRKETDIIIDVDPKIRKYRRFGNCLIGFSHGHAEKSRIGKLMPIEARKDWGETLYHEYHCGHFHSEKAIVEENGVIVRYMSSPTGTDNWHYESGYVGAVKKSQSFLWDEEKGLELIIHTPIAT
jgi:hypothetical protein